MLDHSIDPKLPRDSQLFTVLKNVEVPDGADFDEEKNEYSARPLRVLPCMVLMHWPNGVPCIEMDMYLRWLVDSGLRTGDDGGSVRQEAVKLTPLVRYCFRKEKDLWSLDTSAFTEFIQGLLTQVHPRSKETVRESNQVIEISDSCVRFYFWMQGYLLPDRTIVGPLGKGGQIALKEKLTTTKRYGVRRSWHFSMNPPPSTRQLKVAMPTESIQKLWDIVSFKSNPENASTNFAKAFDDADDLGGHLSYQKHLWHAILQTMQAIGCRPGELAEMRHGDNIKRLRTEKRILLITEKREIGADRTIPVPMNIVIRLTVYAIKHRSEFLDRLRRKGLNPVPNDYFFLNTDGNPLTKTALTKGFERLCKAAMIKERTCLSMFRHRAITILVAIHLKEFCNRKREMAIHSLNQADYSTILAKVASITGHSKIESLRPYIDLAWRELGAFDSVDASIRLVTMMQGVVLELAPSLEKIKQASLAERERYLAERLAWFEMIVEDMKQDVEAMRQAKVDPAVAA
jgi:integrase